MTVIGGAIGAAIGSYWGPAGAKWGWAIGSTLGGLLSMSDQKNMEIGKMSDQSFSGSSYGVTYPMVWGEYGVKVGGNILWVMSYKDGSPVPTGTADAVTMLEHSRQEGGGGKGMGGGGTTTYYYSATYLVAWCIGSWLDSEENEITRNHFVKKIIANDKVVWELGASDNIATVTNYGGTLTDARPSTMTSVEGTDNVTAQRGIVKSIISLDLEQFGNNHVSFQAVVATDEVTDGDIVKDILLMSNIKEADIDVAAGNTVVDGFKIENKTTAQTEINNLSLIFCRDLVEVDGMLKYIDRGEATLATITKNELGVVLNSDKTVPALAETFQNYYSLPGQVRFTYINKENNWNADTQSRVRQTSDIENKLDINAPIVLTPTQAKRVATRLLNLAWAEQVSYTFSLPYKYIYLTPGDCINIPVGAKLQRVRIIDMDIALFGEIRITALPDYEELYDVFITSSATTYDNVPNYTVSNTDFAVWSGTELRPEHRKSSGFYVVANGNQTWTGCNVYYSVDGTEWILGGEITSRGTFGSATDLADGASADSWDLINTIEGTFDYVGIAPTTVSEDAVLNGKNVAVIWNDTADNNANLEVFGFAGVTPTGVKQYEFDVLRRGMLLSDYTGHANGDKIVLPSLNSTLRIPVGDEYVGETLSIRCVSPGQTIASAEVISREQTVTIVERIPESIDLGGTVKGGTAHSVLFINSEIKTAEDNPDFTYNAGTNLLSTPNLTVASALKISSKTSTHVAYYGTSGEFQGSANLTFDGAMLAMTAAISSTRGILIGPTANFYQSVAASGSGNTAVSAVISLNAGRMSLITANHTHTSNTESSFEIGRTFNPSSASSGRLRIMNFAVTASGSQNLTDNTSALVGVEGSITNNNTGTVTAATGFIGFFVLGANSTTSRLVCLDAYGGDVSGSGSVGGTVSENFNIIIRGPRSSGNTSLGNVPVHGGIWFRSNTWTGTGHVTAQYGIGHYTWANPMYAVTANSQTRIFIDVPEMPSPGAFSSTVIAAIRFQTGTRAKRNGLQWGTDANANLYSDAANSIITDGKFTSATLKVGTSSIVGQALCATDTAGNVAFTTIVGKRFATVLVCAGFTPAGTGADIAEIVIPYSPADGTTSITYNVRRIDFRVNVAGGAPAMTLEKSTGTGAFSASTIGTVTLGSGAYEGNNTSGLGTVASGNKVRMNVGTLGTATGWTVQMLLEAQ